MRCHASTSPAANPSGKELPRYYLGGGWVHANAEDCMGPRLSPGWIERLEQRDAYYAQLEEFLVWCRANNLSAPATLTALMRTKMAETKRDDNVTG
jgi:hypothetical protein